jgi:hypothetical protein
MILDLRIGTRQRFACAGSTAEARPHRGATVYSSYLLKVSEQSNRSSCPNSSGTIATHCTELAVHVLDKTATSCKFTLTHV